MAASGADETAAFAMIKSYSKAPDPPTGRVSAGEVLTGASHL